MHCPSEDASAIRRLCNTIACRMAMQYYEFQFRIDANASSESTSMQSVSTDRCSGIAFEILISWLMIARNELDVSSMKNYWAKKELITVFIWHHANRDSFEWLLRLYSRYRCLVPKNASIIICTLSKKYRDERQRKFQIKKSLFEEMWRRRTMWRRKKNKLVCDLHSRRCIRLANNEQLQVNSIVSAQTQLMRMPTIRNHFVIFYS